MFDTSHWKLRGPVKSMLSELTDWDTDRKEWKPARFRQSVLFDADGRVLQLDQRGFNDSTHRQTYEYDPAGRLLLIRSGTLGEPPDHQMVFAYDAQGRLIRVVTVDPADVERPSQTCSYDDHGRRTAVHDLAPAPQGIAMSYAVDGSEFGYGAEGATRQTTTYDEYGRSVESIFEDAAGEVIRRVFLTRDTAGRVVDEESQAIAAFAVPESPDLSVEDRATMQALMLQAFGSIKTSNQYDAAGHLMLQTRQSGRLGETRTTYAYDERDNPIEQSEIDVQRGMNVDTDGTSHVTPDTTRIHDTRFAYVYDAHGNWTERSVSGRFSADGEFGPSNAERRAIEYW